MPQTKLTLTKPLMDFLKEHQAYGFKDKSSMARHALQSLQKELQEQELQKSAKLYAELLEDDKDLRFLTEAAVQEWPK
jgi:Arc/MetJ-type ribon-helix-helix transcriptional regulator